MIQSFNLKRFEVRKGLILVTVLSSALSLAHAQREDVSRKLLPISVAAVQPPPGTARFKPAYNTARWQDQEYPAAEAIPLLLDVIVDSRTVTSVRAQALDELGRLGQWLQNTQHIPKLIGLYEELHDREERAGVLVLLVKTEDPRALPLFVKVLDEEQDLFRRLVAAIGLASWNIGRGVGELIRLLECTLSIKDCAAVRDQAANSLHGLNERKGWGCPEDELREVAVKVANGDSEEYVKTFARKYGEWFDVNRDRFPDWKLGDPLPSVEVQAPSEKPVENP